MSGQFEQPKDADDGEELEDVCVLQMGGHSLKDQIDVEAQRGHVIDDVDTVTKYIDQWSYRTNDADIVWALHIIKIPIMVRWHFKMY